MEKAGRRKLLLTGFISIAFCNLLMTIVDSILVSSAKYDCDGVYVFLPLRRQWR